jgi:uncharacterized membrane protein HdeD (DUF308 family)
MTKRNTRGFGLVLIIVGLLFLLSQFLNTIVGAFTWPFSIIVPGVLLLVAAFMFRTSVPALAIPGSIVSMIGLILFTQNVTGHFESWSYAWGLIVAAVGSGIFLFSSWSKDERTRKRGSQLALLGLVLFVVFGAFFELLIFRTFTNNVAWQYVLPILLVGGGAYLMLRKSKQGREEKSPPSTPEPKPQ